MTDKMREEFEEWCQERGYTLAPAETNCNIIIEGAYKHSKVQIAWEAWQASQNAFVKKFQTAVTVALLEDDDA